MTARVSGKSNSSNPFGEQPPESLFWIALRFFIGEGNPHFDLAQWVLRAFDERAREPVAKVAVKYIAAFRA